jgi:hypothetical protein
VETFGCGNTPQAELGGRLGGRLSHQRLEQTLALVELVGFEQRFGQLHARRQIVR